MARLGPALRGRRLRSSLWQGEIANAALVSLAAVAPATRRIVLGTGVNLAFAHSPVMFGA